MPTNIFVGNRACYDNAIWYAAKVYKANEKLLLMAYTSNSATYNAEDAMLYDLDKDRKCPKPSGIFKCKPAQSFEYDKYNLADNSLAQNERILIETNDYVGDLDANDFVFYEGEWYIVENVRKYIRAKTRQFMKNGEYHTLIALRR